MLEKILAKEMLRKKTVAFALLAFIALAAMLAASGVKMISELTGAIDILFKECNPPDFVQMHSGALDKREIEKFGAENALAGQGKIVEMISLDNPGVFLGAGKESESSSIMDISFVTQNEGFDRLLDLQNRPLNVAVGEIAVPVYCMQKKKLRIGDAVELRKSGETLKFTISAFVRDAMMNPASVSSKRFVVNESDYAKVGQLFPKREYLVEFMVPDKGKLSEFERQYRAAGLPRKGPTITKDMFKLLNSISDGIIVVILILISLFLLFISLLCLRFIMNAAMEDDYREIGVMKAIGVSPSQVKRVFLSKYLIIAGIATAIGYVCSFPFVGLFTGNIMLYMGTASVGAQSALMPLASVMLVFMIVWSSSLVILRKFDKISAVEAIRAGNLCDTGKAAGKIDLSRNKLLDINIILAIGDVLRRFKSFLVLFAVFAICVCVMIIPENFLNTIEAPSFVGYMGIGSSDIRIDLRQTDDSAARFSLLKEVLGKDPDIKRFSPFITSQFEYLDKEGISGNLNVESGTFGDFPVDYLDGRAPERMDDIALSYLAAEDMGRSVGERMEVSVAGKMTSMRISGIYQDITNGGKTAKAAMAPNEDSICWYVISADFAEGVDAERKTAEYRGLFPDAKVNHIKTYLRQTLGDTISQVGKISALAFWTAIAMSILISALFVKMLMAKDFGQNAILRSLGFTSWQVRFQYMIRIAFAMAAAIIFGTMVSNTLGQALVGAIWSFMGATRIRFIVDPLLSYFAYPASLLAAVAVTTFLCTFDAKKTSITKMIVE